MAIDTETVKRVAFLSRLKVDDDKICRKRKRNLNKILGWIEQLNEVDTDNVEPLVSVNQTNLECRADAVNDGEKAEAVLANAPMQEFGYFVVPKVVE